MHHMTLKAAVAKYGEKYKEGGLANKDELVDLIKQDEAKYTDEDALLIADSVMAKPSESGGSSNEPPVPSNKPNAVLDLSGFDYKSLTGDSFKKYDALVSAQNQNEQFDFEQFRVTAVMKERYPGLPETPIDFDGITITNDKPVHTSRMTIKGVMNLNAQVRNTNRYYLLKK